MFTIYEILNGRFTRRVISSTEEFCLKSMTHLMMHAVAEDIICIINSFSNKCFLISKKDWHGCGTYPTDFSKFIEKPAKPSEEIDLPEERIRLSNNSVSFVIVPSYDCNLRCKYCYQQCNPELSREKITDDNLCSILSTIERYHLTHPEKYISIELFGGEPLLPENRDVIIRIFDFCVNNRFPVGITTNGVNLPFYLKDLVIYSGLNIQINTTIDSIAANECTRTGKSSEVDPHSSRILKAIRTLIHYGITVNVEMNIDQHNIDQLEDMIGFYRRNEYLASPLFNLGIARIDDRRFETGYDKMVTDTQLIAKLTEIKFDEPNIYFSFVKSMLALCRKIYPDFRQQELKYISNYCWASAPVDNVFYIDPDLDVYRCTFTVGRKQYSLFKFSTGAIENYTSPNRTYQEYPQCVECAIGGYCAGGCKLSSDVDFERMCSTEAADFMDFLNTLFYPEIRKKLSTQEIVF